MGTEYGFGALGKQKTSLYVYEMSGVFSLYAEVTPEQAAKVAEELAEDQILLDSKLQCTLADQITPAVLIDAAIKMIQTASYWMHDEDVAAKLPELRKAVPALFRGS